MSNKIAIALDAMGGDHGPSVVVAGAELSLARHPDAEMVFFGDQATLEPLLATRPKLRESARIVHTDVAVKMDEKPSQALRHGRWRSSMWLAIDAVKKGSAGVAVSAGNTGALMAMAKFHLRTMAGIGRPAIAALWPTLRGESIVLDVGATIGADAQHLVELAIMGSAMARVVFDLDRPTVGLLNIGVEEVKGLEEIRDAHRILRELSCDHMDYRGFVEGDDIGKGIVDVIVTEGFTGNIALKTAEGTARQIATYMRQSLGKSLLTRVGALLARAAFDDLRSKLDTRRMNGGVFLGLNGIVIKSHGGTDPEGFASAIKIGYSIARNGLLSKINQDLTEYRLSHASPPPEPSPRVPV